MNMHSKTVHGYVQDRPRRKNKQVRKKELKYGSPDFIDERTSKPENKHKNFSFFKWLFSLFS